MINFKSLYSNTNIRQVEDDIKFDSTSDDWLKEHRAVTKNGSIVIGIIHDYEGYDNSRHFIDCCVLPQIFECINKYISSNKKITYFYEQNLVEENYIIQILKMKYKDRISYEILDKKIVRKIQEVEYVNNIAIITTGISCIYALKYLIESKY